jgi:hypothetical protein
MLRRLLRLRLSVCHGPAICEQFCISEMREGPLSFQKRSPVQPNHPTHLTQSNVVIHSSKSCTCISPGKVLAEVPMLLSKFRHVRITIQRSIPSPPPKNPPQSVTSVKVGAHQARQLRQKAAHAWHEPADSTQIVRIPKPNGGTTYLANFTCTYAHLRLISHLIMSIHM